MPIDDTDPDATLVREIVTRLGRGDEPVSRMADFPHFTFDGDDGEEYVLTDELREKVERELGCRLVERERTVRNLHIVYLTAATND